MSIADGYAYAEENGLVLIVEEEYDDFVPQEPSFPRVLKQRKRYR